MFSRLHRFAPWFAVLALASTSACSTTTLVGSGIAKTESRPVEGVRALDLKLPGKVELTQGTAESLTITADDNVLPEIESRVEGGVLRLGFRWPTNVTRGTPIRVTLAVKTLEAITINGSGDVHAASLRSEKLSVTINGSGDAVFEAIDGERLETSIRGSGDIRAKGRVKALEISIAGSGDVNVASLQADRVKVGIAGSGDAQVWASEALTVRVAGSGDVRYYGDPTVDKAILGSGRVQRVGPAPG